MTQTIAARLPASGAPFAAGGDRPFLLHAGGCWSVLEGRLDLFATRVRDGRAVGARTHLFRVEAGEAVWGVAPHPATGLGVLAVGGTATVLAESDPAALRSLPEFGGERAAVAEALDRWVEHLSEAVAEPLPSKRVHTAAPGTEAMVEEGGCVAAEDAVVWLQPARGTLRLMGRPAGPAAAGGFVPLGGRGWVDAPAPAVIRVHGTEELLASGRVWDALDEAHTRVLSLVAERLAAQDEADRDRLRARARTTGRTLHAALGRLATTLDVAPARGAMRMREPGDADEDTLVAAARLVLEHGGVEVPGRVTADLAGSRDPMGALARAFRVRARRVALTEGWWRGESGPLLGRLAEGGRAVALLPGRKGYDMLDPATRGREPVTAETAQTLTPFAYSFYRPFAPGPLGVMQVVRFGLFGCGRDLATLLGVAVVMALLGLVTPLAVGALFNHIIPGAERSQLAQLTVVLLVCAFATAAFQAVRAVAMLRMESRASAAIQSAVWDRLLSLPLPFFRDYSAGDLAVRAMGVEEIRRILSGAVVGALLSGAFSVSNFALLFRLDAALAVRAVLLIVAALGISLAVSVLQLKHQREILRLRARTSGVVLQLLTGVGKLKMSGAEVQAFGLWSRLFSEQRERQYRSRVAANWLTVFNAAYPVVCAMVLFSAVAGRAAEKGMSTGDFLAFVAAFSVCLSAALSVSAAAVSALGAVPLYEQVKPILHAEPEAHGGKGDPGELMGAVDLQHVTFRYHADGPLVLRDVSVHIRPGEFVAFVGPSGSGKSTIFRMLLGFESPESGSVSYDHQDLAGLDIEAVRRQIGVVMQSGKLMAGDIFTNIVGSSPATLDDAWEAARMAGLDEDLKQMPMGMHTVVSEGGGTLSGGQRQRLMIARAVVHRPRILLFDEATSALDNRTQAIVSQSLDRLKATRVVVAHRLSTVMNADRIYVVQAGVVVESGTPAELLARDGVFAELARRQTA